jgi:hypothetical protein
MGPSSGSNGQKPFVSSCRFKQKRLSHLPTFKRKKENNGRFTFYTLHNANTLHQSHLLTAPQHYRQRPKHLSALELRTLRSHHRGFKQL